MQDYTSQMLNNPMLQSLMSNPDLLRSVLRSNPAVNDVSFLEVHPKRLRTVLGLLWPVNPAVLKQVTLRLAAHGAKSRICSAHE